MPPDSTSTSSFVQSVLQNPTIQLIGLLLTIIGGLLAIFPSSRLWVIKTFKNAVNYISLKFGNSKQRKIQSQVTRFLNTNIGKKYILNHPNWN